MDASPSRPGAYGSGTAPPAFGSSRINVGSAERAASTVGGGLLALAGLLRGGLGGTALVATGGVLLYRGVSGHCPVFEAAGVSTAASDASNAVEIETSVTVNRPRAEVYAFWRTLENLPTFMHHLRSVDQQAGQRSRWVAKGPGGLPDIAWDASLDAARENELLRWHSLPGADVENAGEVRFRDAPAGGTEVHVRISYRPPAGEVGAAVARWLDPVLRQMVKEDVRRFKHILETGEVPTTEGQPSGRDKDEG